jgi:hypothetical protein
MIQEFVSMLFNLMRHVPYLGEEKEKVQWFMICLPKSYRDKIEFLNPKIMDEIIRHPKLCYTQFKEVQKYKNMEE